MASPAISKPSSCNWMRSNILTSGSSSAMTTLIVATSDARSMSARQVHCGDDVVAATQEGDVAALCPCELARDGQPDPEARRGRDRVLAAVEKLAGVCEFFVAR